jgi:hypothetical protein
MGCLERPLSGFVVELTPLTHEMLVADTVHMLSSATPNWQANTSINTEAQ